MRNVESGDYEWVPAYVANARTATRVAVQEVNAEAALIAAVRELAAEVRAMRQQLAGGATPPQRGALGRIEATLSKMA